MSHINKIGSDYDIDKEQFTPIQNSADLYEVVIKDKEFDVVINRLKEYYNSVITTESDKPFNLVEYEFTTIDGETYKIKEEFKEKLIKQLDEWLEGGKEKVKLIK